MRNLLPTMTTPTTVLCACLALTLCTAGLSAPAPSPPDREIVTRSLVSLGDPGRLQRVFDRARWGRSIVVGVIGGSITAGAGASKPEMSYGSLVADWWRQAFPQAQVEFVNAGIGATSSDYGALRYQRDLGRRRPDFVLVEYAVNDPPNQDYAESYEGLLRQVLGQVKSPAVMLVFTMNNAGANAQEWQTKLGRHYGLPMVSFRDALWPEIQAGRLKWEDVEADEVHPNDRGHAAIAAFVTAALEQVLARPAGRRLPPLAALPAPLLTDAFEHTALYEGKNLVPVANQGWTYRDNPAWEAGWEATAPGSTIEFAITGPIVLQMDFRLHGPMGKARVQVDDRPPQVVDAWFEPTWGGWRAMHVLGRGLSPGPHRVRIELLADANPKSGGHRFLVNALGAAGLR